MPLLSEFGLWWKILESTCLWKKTCKPSVCKDVLSFNPFLEKEVVTRLQKEVVKTLYWHDFIHSCGYKIGGCCKCDKFFSQQVTLLKSRTREQLSPRLEKFSVNTSHVENPAYMVFNNDLGDYRKLDMFTQICTCQEKLPRHVACEEQRQNVTGKLAFWNAANFHAIIPIFHLNRGNILLRAVIFKYIRFSFRVREGKKNYWRFTFGVGYTTINKPSSDFHLE